MGFDPGSTDSTRTSTCSTHRLAACAFLVARDKPEPSDARGVAYLPGWNGTLVVPGADGRLWAFDATTGQVLWHKGHDIGGSAAAIYNQLALVVGTQGGRIRAYHA